MNDIHWFTCYHSIMKQLSVANLSCPVLIQIATETRTNHVSISRQAVSKSSQPLCSNKGRSVLIASLYLSLKWAGFPSFIILSPTGMLFVSAKIKDNTEQEMNAAKRPNLSNCLWNCCEDGHRSACPSNVKVECKVL